MDVWAVKVHAERRAASILVITVEQEHAETCGITDRAVFGHRTCIFGGAWVVPGGCVVSEGLPFVSVSCMSSPFNIIN